MLLSAPDNIRKLWDRWNLRGLIIISLSLQAFLIMFASSRKRRGGWKIVMLIWSAYLLADWVATVAIGLISSGLGLTPISQANTSTHRESNDILAFWATFLLLHLGGPDTITSFALEDNELWVRHMLGLALQVLSTVYVFLQSLQRTFCGFLPGHLLSPQERHVSRGFFLNLNSKYVIQIIEIELSILYEVLHSKVQVVRCKTGYIFRSVSFGCILGAFSSFFSVKKHSFRRFDIRLSYGLLIGAMVLDFTSLIFVILSDWTVRGQYLGKRAEDIAARVINRRRWPGSVSQYNFFTYCPNDYPEWINKLAEALRLRSILEAINGGRHRSSKKFRKNQEWHFIFSELRENSRTAKTVAEELCDEDKAKVELCDENKAEDGPSSEFIDYKAICKLLSDYMFYLLMMQPTMMAQARQKIRKVGAKIKPRALKGGESKSVLFDAGILAGELEELNGNRWELMSKVWVEFMSYAAINCGANVHAQQPISEDEAVRLKFVVGK
ncbi:hypothetical protein SLA2020_121230 [Shorea laevis]